MELLRNAVRPYAWGSRTTIPELLGREVPAPHPEAELWMGAHPGDPSRVVGADGEERSLLELIEGDPQAHLGPECSQRWHNRLPFLLKILAVEEPLSMQAHPSAAQSAEGHAREEAAGIPRDAPNRNYPDPTAKPELVCALTEFHALAGFREPLPLARPVGDAVLRMRPRLAERGGVARPALDDRRALRHPGAVVVFGLCVHLGIARRAGQVGNRNHGMMPAFTNSGVNPRYHEQHANLPGGP